MFLKMVAEGLSGGSHITKIDLGDTDLLISYSQADLPDSGSGLYIIISCLRYSANGIILDAYIIVSFFCI